MKRAFIRGLWGEQPESLAEDTPDKRKKMALRRRKMDRNIDALLKCKHQDPFIFYVFGDQNYNYLKKNGFDCVLLDKNPVKFNIVKHMYRHKLEIIKRAMEEYDEIIFLDIDCFQIHPLPSDFWKILNKKEVVQAPLFAYRHVKCPWRKTDKRKVPNGGFVYIRDKSIPDKVISAWEEIGKGDNDEPAWAKLTDDMIGGWQGMEKYWEIFEPPFCRLGRGIPFSEELMKTKNIIFQH